MIFIVFSCPVRQGLPLNEAFKTKQSSLQPSVQLAQLAQLALIGSLTFGAQKLI